MEGSDHPARGSGWVLVADDNEAVRASTVEILATAGFPAKEARDAEEAVRLLARGDVCVLVIDVGVDRRGLTILDRVANLPPVILMSGDTRDPEDPRASVFLSKPTPVHRLIEEVARHALKRPG